MKVGIASRFRGVQLISGATEKRTKKDPLCSYLEPTQVSQGEKPKACRVYTNARELGKLAPYLWYKGCLFFQLRLGEQVAVTKGSRLFNKNTGSRKSESL